MKLIDAPRILTRWEVRDGYRWWPDPPGGRVISPW